MLNAWTKLPVLMVPLFRNLNRIEKSFNRDALISTWNEFPLDPFFPFQATAFPGCQTVESEAVKVDPKLFKFVKLLPVVLKLGTPSGKVLMVILFE